MNLERWRDVKCYFVIPKIILVLLSDIKKNMEFDVEKRDNIPVNVIRAVLVESGHRCAIPTCRATTTEIAHIVPWAKSHDNSFENLIALCPNCHTRFDQKKDIDHLAMKMYKHNLGILNC